MATKKETKKRIYLSAPITGRDRQERESYFADVEDWAKSNGLAVFNPLHNGLAADAPYQQHMKKDITELMKCDMAFFGRGWQQSRGCATEYAVASAIGLQIFTEADL